ncbi:zinc ribbon domain-containing protein [Pseudomonas sp. W22_MBD1_FP4]|uniref:zinc ribbon domain-containing protein n=1 Tax=Pseudomonas sp. W22_MBD1_FP4 TaxID=3240272 RepID=UPI003F99EBE4
MPTTDNLTVLYVYRCTICGHSGEVRLVESAQEVATACSACGAEVMAEWDGGVELPITETN